MSILDHFKKKKEKEEEEVEAIKRNEEPSVDFDAIMKANADKKDKEAAARLKKNKQTLKDYKIEPKPDPKKK